MNVHAKFLRIDQLRHLLSPVLEDCFRAFGFQGIDVMEDETADGLPILRVVADVMTSVPVEDQIAALEAAHVVLRSNGEDRIVFLSARSMVPSVETADEGDED